MAPSIVVIGNCVGIIILRDDQEDVPHGTITYSKNAFLRWKVILKNGHIPILMVIVTFRNKSRWADIPLDKCSTILTDSGKVRDVDNDELSPHLTYYTEQFGIEFKNASYRLRWRKHGQVVFEKTIEQQYLTMDVGGVPEDIEWKGASIEDMGTNGRAFCEAFEANHESFELVIVMNGRLELPDLPKFQEACAAANAAAEKQRWKEIRVQQILRTSDIKEVDEDEVEDGDEGEAPTPIPHIISPQ